MSRPSSVPVKVEYPPPAHTRGQKSSLPVSGHHEKTLPGVGPPHPALPKAELNISLLGYATYPPQPSYAMHDIKVKAEPHQHKQISGVKSMPGTFERDHHGREMLPNPPPLLSDHKSSVIVKNEGRELAKPPSSHSSSPKMITGHYLNPVAPQHKPPTQYEYRSPTQSPHHPHFDTLQVAKGIPQGHHRSSNQLPSPHGHPMHPHNRQSPHAPHPHQTPHPSPPEPRHLSRPEPGIPYGTPKGAYPYPHPPSSSPTSHYAASPGSKLKVSSPAPQHIYGKPNSGIMSGTPVCRAPEPAIPAVLPLNSKANSSPLAYQQVSHHLGVPAPLPPPAHSSTAGRPVYDTRGFGGSLSSASKLPPPPIHHGSPAGANSRPGAVHPAHRTSPHTSQQIHSQSLATAIQTQPLDLGVERSGSPKRKASTPIEAACGQPVSLEMTCKKRRTDETISHPLQCVGPPVLSRVSEPSPLIASAATSITTVVNTALIPQPNNLQTTFQERNVVSVSPAPRTASGDGSVRPASAGSVSSINLNPGASAAPSPAPTQSPAPSAAPSPAPSGPSAPGTPAKATPSNPDSEKSNSPAPRPPSSTSYPVHKLKKAWLQRHSGEDGSEDTTGVVGSGSCVTLPLTKAQAPSQPLQSSKERESGGGNGGNTTRETSGTTSLPSAVNSIHNIGSMAVNSINKTKVGGGKNSAGGGAGGRKSNNKETVNGHAAAADSKNIQEDSSSSDPERKSPPKRKPPKVSINTTRCRKKRM